MHSDVNLFAIQSFDPYVDLFLFPEGQQLILDIISQFY